jgi:hypothetical protein
MQSIEGTTGLGEAFFQDVTGYGVEDSVEEVDGLGGSIAAGYFETLVDDDGPWGHGVFEEFGDGCAKEVAVDDGHALDAPVLGVGLNNGVDLWLAGSGDAVEVFGEAAGLCIDVVAGVPEEFADLFGGLFSEVSLEKHLHREFA